MSGRLVDWVATPALWWLGVAAFVGSLLALPFLVAFMPADYFVRAEPGPKSWRSRHPATRAAARIAKNCLGLVLLAAGAIMLFTPGQGVLTLLLGVSFLDLPGKRRIEQRLLASRPLRRALDAMRRRAGRPPLQFPPD
jgi:UPF0716 family protein affecting phage T7 exclusion